MAKKVVVPDDGPKVKKKRSKCCTCCLAALIVCLLLVAVVACAGWVLGDKYSKKYLDMSMKDAMGVMTGLYGANDKKVVKYGFDKETDLDGFYDELKANIFLRTDKDIDFEAALRSAVDAFVAAQEKQPSETVAPRNSDGDGEAGGGESDGSADIMNVVVDMVSEVFTRENIDVERLSAYDENNDTYFFKLKDKQLAAFISSVLDVLLENSASITGDLPEFVRELELDKVVALKQIKFNAVSTDNELGESAVSATTADLTLWIGLQDAAGQVLTALVEQQGFGWAGGIARWLGNVLLPKNFYVTASVPLYGDAAAQVTINTMTGKKRENTYKLVNGIMGMAGSDDMTVESLLASVVDKMRPILEKVADNIDFTAAIDSGTVNIDIIDALAKTASTSLSPADPLTKPDFIYMLQAVLASSADKKLVELRPYLWNGWYMDADGNMYHKPADTTGLTEINYEDEFISAIEDAYSVEFGEAATLEDVLEMLGISFDGESSGKLDADGLVSLIDGNKFSASLDKDREELKLRVTDKMLAAALDGQMDEMLGGAGSDFDSISARLDALSFINKSDRPGHLYALLAVDIDIAGLLDGLGGGEMLAKLATNILPDKIVVTVTVDITDINSGIERDSAEFMFNDCQNSGRVMAALGKLVPALDLGALSEQIDDMLGSMLDNLNALFDVQLVASAESEGKHIDGALVMPDIFRIVTDKVLVDGEGKQIVTPDELKNVVRGLERNDGVVIGAPTATNYDAFAAELSDKYYLRIDGGLSDFSQITELVGGTFDGNKFRITGDGEGSYLAYDTRGIAELRPIMTGAELGKIMKDELGDNNQFVIESVNTVNGGLVIVLSLPLGEIMPENLSNIMTVDRLYVTASVDTSTVIGEGEDKAYSIDITVNSMDADTYASTLKIAQRYASGFDIEAKVNEFGKTLYKQLADLDAKLGAPSGESFIEFTADGMRLASFYEFMRTKMDIADASPETIKRAVQGMYPRNSVGNTNNYVAEGAGGFIVNRSSVTVFDPTTLLDGVSDINFNGYFQDIIDRKYRGHGITAMQTIILAKNDTGADAEAARKWANDRIKRSGGADVLTASGEYVLLTFEMLMEDFLPTDKTEATGFMPERIYATVALERKTDGSFDNVGLVFNDMDEAAYRVLLAFMGMDDSATDPDSVNIAAITKTCVDKINSEAWLAYLDFEPMDGASAGDVGIGKATATGIAIPSV